LSAFKFRGGDKVTVNKATEAYYSRYAGNPEVIIQPGEVGIVKAVDVPNVRTPGSFVCVDFVKPGVRDSGAPTNQTMWRIGTEASNLRLIHGVSRKGMKTWKQKAKKNVLPKISR
jgi:hypothetical protein